MKKRTALVILLALILSMATIAYAIFGNKDYFDTVKTFNEAKIAMLVILLIVAWVMNKW